jgi:hypothetical protein
MTDYEYIDSQLKFIRTRVTDLEEELAKTKEALVKLRLKTDDHIRRGHWTAGEITSVMERER